MATINQRQQDQSSAMTQIDDAWCGDFGIAAACCIATMSGEIELI